MTKQTKQLIALGGLVIVGGIVAYFMVFNKGDEKPKAPPASNIGEITVPTTPTGTPGTQPANPGAATPTTPGATPVVVDQNLDIPDEHKFTVVEYQWPFPNGGKAFVAAPDRNIFAAFDPFWVQNIDVVDPQRREYIESLKAEWILDGILETEQEQPLFDLNGKALMGKSITAPKPKTESVVKLDKDGKAVFDKDGNPVIEKRPVLDENGEPVYEPELDEAGNPKKDKEGNPVYIQEVLYEKVDADGKPVLDEKGNPVILRNPPPEARIRRLVVQVPLKVKVPVLDENGIPKLDKQGNAILELKEALDKDGKPILVDDTTPQTVVKMVLEATFKDKRRPYKETDRLTGTRFTILKIFLERRYYNDSKTDFQVRSGVDLISDTGALLTIFVTEDGRYDETEKKGK